MMKSDYVHLLTSSKKNSIYHENFLFPLKDCEKSSANDQQNLFESVCVSSSNTTTSSTDLSDYNNTSTSGNTATTNTNSSSNNNSSNNSNQLNGQDSFPAAPAASGGGEYKILFFHYML